MKERLTDVPLHSNVSEPVCALTAFALAVEEGGERRQKHNHQQAEEDPDSRF